MSIPEDSIFKKLGNLSTQWSLGAPGLFSVASINYSTNTWNTVEVPESVMDNFHPKLSASIKAMISWNEKIHEKPQCSGFYIKSTLLYLVDGCTEITDSDGETYKFYELESFSECEHDKDTMALTGSYFKIDNLELNGESQSFVTADNWIPLRFNKAYLDAQYPGWSKKLEIFNALDFPSDTLLPTIFGRSPGIANSNNLNTEISF